MTPTSFRASTVNNARSLLGTRIRGGRTCLPFFNFCVTAGQHTSPRRAGKGYVSVPSDGSETTWSWRIRNSRRSSNISGTTKELTSESISEAVHQALKDWLGCSYPIAGADRKDT